MTKYTHNYSLPYPEGNDAVAVHTDIEDLAKRMDMVVPAETERVVDEAVSEATEPIQNQVNVHERRIASVSQGEEALFRVLDQAGSVALEVDAQGRTHLYDAVNGGGSGPRITQWHAFLAVGQSNMSGSGRPISDELDPVDDRILQYGANNRTLRPATVPLDMHNTNVSAMSPANAFAREYLRHQPAHVGVLLIPAARSGTSFNSNEGSYTWRPGAASSPELGLYEQSVQQTLEAMDSIGGTGVLRGILWHQGEGNTAMTTEEYAAELDNLITHYRDDLGIPDLPFVVGQMSQERMVMQTSRRTIDRAHYETPARVPRTGFAPSEWGWTARSDDETHFGRTGTIGMGKNMVTAYYQALGNTDESRILPPHNVTTKRVGDQVTVAWEAPTSRVHGYQITTRPIGSSTWEPVARESDMKLSETFTAPDPIDIEIRSYRDTEESTRYLTQA